MPWARLDDGYDTHPKTEVTDLLDLAASGLHAQAIAHCSKHLTDGRVSAAWIAGKLHALRPRQRNQLVGLMLHRRLFEPLPDGDDLLVHDYLDYNPSREDVEADRERSRQRQERARQRRLQGQLPWDGVTA